MVKNITFYCLQFEKSTYLCTWLWPMQGLDFLNNNNIDIQILENFLLMKSSNQNIWGALYLVAALLLSASCSEYNPDMSEGNLTKEEYEKVMEFTQNFKLRYGEIAPDNDWGFGELEVKGSRGVKGTRGVLANKNEWFKDGSVIPGMPSAIDGRYILKNSGSGKEVKMYDTYTSYDVNNQIPAGDVTDEEIIYVSEWFRTHPNPTSQAVNLRDFYVQNVSWDYDRQEYPNGAKETHVKWLDGNNAQQQRELNYRMDHLLCVSYSNSDGNHIYNMNNGNTNMADVNKTYNDISAANSTECGRLFEYRTMERYQCVDGEPNVTSFKAHSSDDNRYLTNYVLVHLEFTGPKSGLPYSGDYLAFDYSFDGKSFVAPAAIKAPDGYYSNWIFKISPAYPTTTPDPEPTTETKRVMCEDLGNTYDFDFNDLVFDVYYTYKGTEANKTNITAHITLQAVGGTLPIYIGTDTADPTKELHYRMLGQASSSPINVAASNGVTHSPVSFTMSATSTDPNDIIICVGTAGNEATDKITILPVSGRGSSLAPQKICVPDSTKWLKENMQIEQGYTKFQDWVNNGRNTEYDVWTTGIKEDFLYK